MPARDSCDLPGLSEQPLVEGPVEGPIEGPVEVEQVKCIFIDGSYSTGSIPPLYHGADTGCIMHVAFL